MTRVCERMSYEESKNIVCVCRLESLTLEVTPSATQFFKRSYKISLNPGL
jgi:hypothetical protein